jgi:hypothetical protein
MNCMNSAMQIPRWTLLVNLDVWSLWAAKSASGNVRRLSADPLVSGSLKEFKIAEHLSVNCVERQNRFRTLGGVPRFLRLSLNRQRYAKKIDGQHDATFLRFTCRELSLGDYTLLAFSFEKALHIFMLNNLACQLTEKLAFRSSSFRSRSSRNVLLCSNSSLGPVCTARPARWK